MILTVVSPMNSRRAICAFDIHQHHVRAQRPDHPDAVVPFGGLAENLDTLGSVTQSAPEGVISLRKVCGLQLHRKPCSSLR